MKIEMLEPSKITLSEMFKMKDSLYSIVFDEKTKEFSMKKLVSDWSLDMDTISGIDIQIVRIETDTANKARRFYNYSNGNTTKTDQPKKKYSKLTYKFSGDIPLGAIEFKPPTGGFRVSFDNKKDAEEWYDYFREQFYSSDVPAISIASIYEDLGVVDYDKEECEKWGYPTLTHGVCRYISPGVTKTVKSSRFGFGLERPVIIHGMVETKWYQDRKKEGRL